MTSCRHTEWMKTSGTKDLMYFVGVAICQNLDADLTLFIRGFDLCPLSEAICTATCPLEGMSSVCYPEIGGSPYFRG